MFMIASLAKGFSKNIDFQTFFKRLRWSGREDHRLGAAVQKAQSPIVQSVVLLQSWRRLACPERRWCEEEWGVMSFFKGVVRDFGHRT